MAVKKESIIVLILALVLLTPFALWIAIPDRIPFLRYLYKALGNPKTGERLIYLAVFAFMVVLNYIYNGRNRI